MRSAAVRETGVIIGIMGYQLKATLKPSVDHITIVLRGLRGALNWAPNVPRDASLSNSGCEFLQSGYAVYAAHHLHKYATFDAGVQLYI